MMAHIGNHLKMTLPDHLRPRAREFYGTLLGCKPIPSPRPDLDLYEFAGGFVLGLFFAPEGETLSDADYFKATWMEMKVDKPLLLPGARRAGLPPGSSGRRALTGHHVPGETHPPGHGAGGHRNAPHEEEDSMTSERDQFLQTWDAEFATTRKIMAAIPEAKRDFRPHEKSMTARELAWHLVGLEQFFVEGALARTFEFAKGPEPPATLREILAAFDRQHAELAQKLRATDAQKLEGTVKFFVAPKQMGDVPLMMVLWMGVVMHGVHHRGQFSVYLRMMGEKVPSIYGPSLDEPWF